MCDNINIKKVGKLVTKERADADELAKKVRVLCWIMTGPDNHEAKVGAGEIPSGFTLGPSLSSLSGSTCKSNLGSTMQQASLYELQRGQGPHLHHHLITIILTPTSSAKPPSGAWKRCPRCPGRPRQPLGENSGGLSICLSTPQGEEDHIFCRKIDT